MVLADTGTDVRSVSAPDARSVSRADARSASRADARSEAAPDVRACTVVRSATTDAGTDAGTGACACACACACASVGVGVGTVVGLGGRTDPLSVHPVTGCSRRDKEGAPGVPRPRAFSGSGVAGNGTEARLSVPPDHQQRPTYRHQRERGDREDHN